MLTDGPFGHSAMQCFPLEHVRWLRVVARVSAHGGGDVDHHERAQRDRGWHVRDGRAVFVPAQAHAPHDLRWWRVQAVVSEFAHEGSTAHSAYQWAGGSSCVPSWSVVRVAAVAMKPCDAYVNSSPGEMKPATALPAVAAPTVGCPNASAKGARGA